MDDFHVILGDMSPLQGEDLTGPHAREQFGGIGRQDTILSGQAEDRAHVPAEVIDDTEGTTRGGFLFQILLEPITADRLNLQRAEIDDEMFADDAEAVVILSPRFSRGCICSLLLQG